jgi:hypothetical protein
MQNTPNVINDEVYFYDHNCELHLVDEIEINWDLEGEGRYICLK